MLEYVSRPFYDIIAARSLIRETPLWHQKFGHTERMIKAAARIAIVAAALIALQKFGVPKKALGLAIGFTSLPCVFILSGCMLLRMAASRVVSAVAARSFSPFASGMFLSLCGGFCLQIHDIISFGAGEIILNYAAKKAARPLARVFAT